MDNDDGNDGHDEDPGEDEAFDGLEDINEQLDGNLKTPDNTGAQINMPLPLLTRGMVLNLGQLEISIDHAITVFSHFWTVS